VLAAGRAAVVYSGLVASEPGAVRGRSVSETALAAIAGGASRPRAFVLVFVALTVAHVSLVLSVRLFPFVDLPNHLAEGAIYRHLGAPTNRLAEYYRLGGLLEPNVFHMVALGSRLFPDVETANRVLHALYVVALPAGVLLLVRRFGGDPWLALGAFLLLYNNNVSWGFLGFVLATPLVLLVVWEAGDRRAAGRGWRPAGLSLLLLLIFWMHALAACFALLLHGLLCLWRARRAPADALIRALAAVPVAAWLGAWWLSTQGTGEHDSVGYVVDYYARRYWPELPERLELAFQDNAALFAAPWGERVGWLFALVIALPPLRLLWAAPRDAWTRLGQAGAAPLAILLAAAVACALLLPAGLPGQTHIYERFSVFVLLGLGLAGSVVLAGRVGRAHAVVLTAACLLHLGLWSGYFRAFDRENAGFDRAFLPAGPPGARLAGLIYDWRFRDRPVYIHFPAYYTVWHQGIATTRIVDFRFGPVRRRASEAALPTYAEWIGRTRRYDGRYAGLEYILWRARHQPGETDDGFRRIRSAGRWALYAR
jgi:hypothetical protein